MIDFTNILTITGKELRDALRNRWFIIFTIAFAGLKSTLGPFWAMSTGFLTGTAAAGGIALINSVGNLGGFFGPTLVGMIKDRTGSDFGALLLLGGSLLGMGVIVLAIPKNAPASKHQ